MIEISAGFRILPAGYERLKRAGERGCWPAYGFGDDPALPIRELSVERDGRALTVWLGPVYPGGAEEELWELDVKA